MLAVGLVGTAAAEHDRVIYRCIDRHGVTYSDRPCAPPGPALARVDLDDLRTDRGEPAQWAYGMSTGEVMARYGRPYETRVLWRNRTLSEVWTWRGRGQAFSVTFRDGRVVDP